MNTPRIAAIAVVAIAGSLWLVARHTTTAPGDAEAAPGSDRVAIMEPTAAAAVRQPVPVAAEPVAADLRAAAPTPGSTSSTMAADGGVRGVVRAVREATLSSRLAARIAEMPLAEGASFSTGALLVRFDCERQAAEARAAAAAVEVQKKTVDTNEELDKFESIGKNDLSVSRSVLDKAVAESDALKAQLKDCNVYAPFSGRVVERLAHSFEGVTVGQPLLRVVDTSALELDLIAPSAWLQWLAQGSEFQFKIDETGQTVPGTVLRLTPSVDPVSKTIRVIGQFQPGKAGNRVLPGMSGTALFPNQQH